MRLPPWVTLKLIEILTWDVGRWAGFGKRVFCNKIGCGG